MLARPTVTSVVLTFFAFEKADAAVEALSGVRKRRSMFALLVSRYEIGLWTRMRDTIFLDLICSRCIFKIGCVPHFYLGF